MTAHATPEQVAELQEAADSLLSRAAHLHDIARELEAIAEYEVPDEHVVEATRRLVELDQLLSGETVLPDASVGIPGLDELLEHHEQLVEDE